MSEGRDRTPQNHNRRSPHPFVLEGATSRSGPPSPETVTVRLRSPLLRSVPDSRPSNVMEDSPEEDDDDDRSTPSDSSWNAGGEGPSRQSGMEWVSRETRRIADLIRNRPSPIRAMPIYTGDIDDTDTSRSPSAAMDVGSERNPWHGGEMSTPPNRGSPNDENGERTPDEGNGDNGEDSESTPSSPRTSTFNGDLESLRVDRNRAERSDENESFVIHRLRHGLDSDSSGDGYPYPNSPTIFTGNRPLRDSRRQLGSKTAGENTTAAGGSSSQRNSQSSNNQPLPLKIDSKTRLKVTVTKWNVCASWKWTAGDETCGICRMPFEACCIECKTPGDECPIALGACKHAFHMHCIVKWTDTQNTPRPQCPLCRQEWKFAS